MRVVALTSGRNTPSTRFRIRQHINPLSEYGIEVCEYLPLMDKEAPLWLKSSNFSSLKFLPVLPLSACRTAIKVISRIPGIVSAYNGDVLWLSRSLCPRFPTLERFLAKPLVLDVDDAVWCVQPFGAKVMSITAKRSDIVLAGNTYIANWFDKFNKNVVIIPTSIDEERFSPIHKPKNEKFIVGWTGTNGNFKYLYTIRDAIFKFLNYASNSVIRIVADKFPVNLNFPKEKIDFHYWSEDNEANLVQTMDVGIMPMPYNEWTHGKCAFKMLQYMACGLPVIVSPVGMNLEVLEKGALGIGALHEKDWTDALIHLYENRELCSQLGKNGRSVIESTYSRKLITKKLANIFLSFDNY